MKSKHTAFILAITAAFLLVVTAHIRIIQIYDQPIVLLHHPFFRGGSSAGSDIRDSFHESGKSEDSILDITYIGTNSDGNYYKCTYKEANGSVSVYYAFDDGDLNSTVRAKVLWEEP